MKDPGLDDWRLILLRLEASYRCATYADAAALVAAIAAAHEVVVDLRPGALVRVSLPMNDVATAEAISALAATAGATADPHAGARWEVAIDAMDIPKVKPFWRVVLGYVEVDGNTLADPAGSGPPFWFQQMDAPRSERSTFHIDVSVPHDVAEARVAAAIAAGGTLLTDQYARAYWVLADAEGNEACVCTWQDRG
jgi:4a-hydroxytetrahydrobiopterin dehydratase